MVDEEKLFKILISEYIHKDKFILTHGNKIGKTFLQKSFKDRIESNEYFKLIGETKMNTEFNLTIGQAIDLMQDGYPVCNEKNPKIKYFMINSIIKAQDNTYSAEGIAYVSLDFIERNLGYFFKEYTDPKEVKMITWYIPTIIWHKNAWFPLYDGSKCYKNKDEFFTEYSKKEIKVLEWKEIQAPETWEQCE